MTKPDMTRTPEPIFWGLFGAGGMWSAIFFPVLIVIVAFILPFSSTLTQSNIWALSGSCLGRVFLFASIVLPLWCALHRIHHAIHDFKLHLSHERRIIYGLAVFITLLAAYWCLSLA